jgi:hypothetical protein
MAIPGVSRRLPRRTAQEQRHGKFVAPREIPTIANDSGAPRKNRAPTRREAGCRGQIAARFDFKT